MTQRRSFASGFTLIELILVVAIIALLAVIVLLAINPNRQFAQTRNARRQQDGRELYDALRQQQAGNQGTLTDKITPTPQNVCDGDKNVYCEAGTIDLRPDIVPVYIPGIPVDPKTGSKANTHYTVYRNGRGEPVVIAGDAELGVTIEFGTNVAQGNPPNNPPHNNPPPGGNPTPTPTPNPTPSPTPQPSPTPSPGGNPPPAPTPPPDFAVRFDGNDDYVNVPNSGSLAIGNSVTVSFWIRYNSDPFIFDGIIGRTNTVVWTQGWGFYFVGSNTIKFFVEGWSAHAAVVGGLVKGQWNHVVGVWDGTNITAYVNNSPGTPAAYNGSITNTSGGIEIGRLGDNLYNYGGDIDDIRIYTRALSSGEINALYTGGNVGGNLVGKWVMNEGSGATAGDTSGSNNNGSLVNGPTWVTH